MQSVIKFWFVSIFIIGLSIHVKAKDSDSQFDEINAIYDAYFRDSQKELAIHRLDSLIHFYESKKDKKASAAFLNVRARLHNEEGTYLKAIEISEKVEHLISNEAFINSTTYLSNAYLNIGISYDLLGFYEKSIDYYFKALRIQETRNDSLGMTMSLINIGNIQMSLDDVEQAIFSYRRGMEIAEAISDTLTMSTVYTNLAGLYIDSHIDSARYYTSKIFELNKDYPDYKDLIYAYSLLSDICKMEGKTDSALYYQKISADYSVDYGSYFEKADALLTLSSSYIDLYQLKLARESANKALDFSLKNRLKETAKQSYSNLFKIDSLEGHYKNALINYQLAEIYHDSLQNEDAKKEAFRNQVQYDFDKREAIAREELKRQQIVRNIFIVGFIVMIGTSTVILKQRNRISKEKDRSENLLLNILPYETAQELKQKGYADAQVINEVTVLFTDFKGFTQLSETLSPSDLVAAIHECFSAFDQIMEKYKVEKIKTIGDAYMAAGGLPTVNQTHAQDVVNAALDIQAYMKQHIEDKIQQGLPYFEIRIGVHTGPVVAGIVGIKKFQYDIWGDTVNTASRMESSGEVGKVNISSLTYSKVKDDFNCEYRGEIEAKGKGKIGMYFVSGAKTST